MRGDLEAMHLKSPQLLSFAGCVTMALKPNDREAGHFALAPEANEPQSKLW